ncbi:MAG: type 4a pilus biogenesis protein PilO [Dehalobacterium sp.]
MLEKMSARERSLLAILLGVILIAIIYFGFIKYLYPQYRQVKDDLNFKKESLIEVNSRINQLSYLEEKNSELNNRLKNLTNSFNKEVRNGINYYYVGKHAVDNSVVIRELIPEPFEDYDQYVKIPLKITVRGKYRNILNFIEQIENDMPNTSEIISLEIQPAGWDKLVAGNNNEKVVENEKAAEEETDAETEKNTSNSIKDVVVNSLTGRISNSLSGTPDQGKEDVSSDLKILSNPDPDVDVYLTLVTYAVKSPEVMELAKEKPIGRLDAFSPTVDIPVAEPEIPLEEDAVGDLFPGETDYNYPGQTIAPPWPSNDPSDGPEDNDESKVENPSPTVPEVNIEKTGDYSFPVRQADRDKEETTNEE